MYAYFIDYCLLLKLVCWNESMYMVNRDGVAGKTIISCLLQDAEAAVIQLVNSLSQH